MQKRQHRLKDMREKREIIKRQLAQLSKVSHPKANAHFPRRSMSHRRRNLDCKAHKSSYILNHYTFPKSRQVHMWKSEERMITRKELRKRNTSKLTEGSLHNVEEKMGIFNEDLQQQPLDIRYEVQSIMKTKQTEIIGDNPPPEHHRKSRNNAGILQGPNQCEMTTPTHTDGNIPNHSEDNPDSISPTATQKHLFNATHLEQDYPSTPTSGTDHRYTPIVPDEDVNRTIPTALDFQVEITAPDEGNGYKRPASHSMPNPNEPAKPSLDTRSILHGIENTTTTTSNLKTYPNGPSSIQTPEGTHSGNLNSKPIFRANDVPNTPLIPEYVEPGTLNIRDPVTNPNFANPSKLKANGRRSKDNLPSQENGMQLHDSMSSHQQSIQANNIKQSLKLKLKQFQYEDKEACKSLTATTTQSDYFSNRQQIRRRPNLQKLVQKFQTKSMDLPKSTILPSPQPITSQGTISVTKEAEHKMDEQNEKEMLSEGQKLLKPQLANSRSNTLMNQRRTFLQYQEMKQNIHR